MRWTGVYDKVRAGVSTSPIKQAPECSFFYCLPTRRSLVLSHRTVKKPTATNRLFPSMICWLPVNARDLEIDNVRLVMSNGRRSAK
jgi:hypothetical protein